MVDDLSGFPGGTGGALGALVAAVGGGLLWLRKFLSRDAADRAADGAEKDIIDILRQQLQLERERSDKLVTSLDAANEQIGQLRAQVAELSAQVRGLQSQLSAFTPERAP